MDDSFFNHVFAPVLWLFSNHGYCAVKHKKGITTLRPAPLKQSDPLDVRSVNKRVGKDNSMNTDSMNTDSVSNASMSTVSMKAEKKDRSILLWILVIAAPLIAGWILGLVSGTNPLHLDAWNTGWNDENGYFRVIHTLRYYGMPKGITGFNEITSGNIPYGPYNIFTYIPYFLLSFATGCESHNYIYICNIIFAVAANLIFVFLVRPGRKNSFLLAVFFLTQLVVARYTWSGMAEACYHFYIVVFMGLVIWYLKNEDASRAKKAFALLFMVLLTFFFSVMRPYFVPLFLIPLYLLIFRNSRIGELSRFIFALVIMAAMIGSLVLMYFFMGYIAEYFEAAPAMRLAQIVQSGQIRDVALGLLQANKESVKSAIELVREYRWAGGIAFLFYFEWIILFFNFVFSLATGKKDGRAAVMFLLLVSGAMIYEATIMLYKAYQLHRMMLAITIAYSIFLIEFSSFFSWLNAAAVIGVVAFYIVMQPSSFALPQAGADSITQAELETCKKQMIAAMPYSRIDDSSMKTPFSTPDSLDPYWENTVAKITEDNHIQLSYILPDYLSMNFCTEKFMKQSVKNNSFCSRYIMVKTGTEIDEMCRTRYSVIWEGYGHTIFDSKSKASKSKN